MVVTRQVHRDVRRLDAGNGAIARLQAEVVDRFAGEQRHEPVRAGLDLDLSRDVTEDDTRDDAGEPVTQRRRSQPGRRLALRLCLCLCLGERGEVAAVDAAVAGLVDGGRDPAGIGPAAYGVRAHAEQICGFSEPIERHVRQSTRLRLAASAASSSAVTGGTGPDTTWQSGRMQVPT